MPSPSPFMARNQLQEAVSRTGNDLPHLRSINQRVSRQVRDLRRHAELKTEVIAKRQRDARTHTNPHTLETGEASSAAVIKAGARGRLRT